MKKTDISKLIPTPKTKFLRVKCNGCGNEQVIFSSASSKVLCLACNQELAVTGASQVTVKTKVLKVYD